MAVNKEIWINSIIEEFFPNNSFVSRSVDHSGYVNGAKVHVPIAGNGPIVTKFTGSATDTVPVQAQRRSDSEGTYDMERYYTKPITIDNLLSVELSYDKRSSIMKQCKEALQKAVMDDLLAKWGFATTQAVATTGSLESGRKKVKRADILAVKRLMDAADVPSDGRCFILDAEMYNQLLDSLTDAEAVNFAAGANGETGVIGRLLGFEFYMRSQVLKATASGGVVYNPDPTDVLAGFAWHPTCVSRALGDIEVFESERDPGYFGDVISFAMRAGGSALRPNGQGIVRLYQGQ